MSKNVKGGGNSVNYASNSNIFCNYVNNSCQVVNDMNQISNNIETEGLQDIGFTPSSLCIDHTMSRPVFVDLSKVFDNANMHIDRIDCFCNNRCQGTVFPYDYLVFLHGVTDPDTRGFYYASLDTNNIVTLYACEEVPVGVLQVLSSQFMYVYHDTCPSFNLLAVEECQQAKVTFNDWKKDIFIEEILGITYCEYIVDIVDKLISQQKVDLDNHQDCDIEVNDTQTVSSTYTNTELQIPRFLEGVWGHNVDINDKCHDPNFPNKVRGFLNNSSADFTFIGPDRTPVHIDTVDKCIQIADIIRQTGLPNYQAARFPLSSGLNIEAWEHLLKDYPDKFLIQYLKFGFPLSICNHDNFKISNVTNHHSATQYPQAVQDYISKELKQGALLGPVDHIHSPHLHCSPLLTRPKDEDKRRIILNLSHPKGASFNDNVDKANFDNRSFSLKLVTVDDIVQEILALDDPLIFKIDVSRAFRNLRVDPVDVLKLAIVWDGSYYLNSAIVFG